MKSLVIPDGSALHAGLNSYYVDVPKLLEHFKESSFTGYIHFKSFQAQGIVYLDADGVMAGQFQDRGKVVEGQDVVTVVIEAAQQNNFTIDLVELDTDLVHYWSSLTDLEEIHSALSSEFTDLEALVKKMSNEKLTGYIEIMQDEEVLGYVFFNNGAMVPPSFTVAGKSETHTTPEELILASRRQPCLFNVARVQSGSRAKEPEEQEEQRPAEGQALKTLDMLQDLLVLMRQLVDGHKKVKESFETLFKRKCMGKVDVYDFLDPFAAEFVFENNRVEYYGHAPDEDLARGILECVREVASETDLTSELARRLGPWKEKYAEEISRLDLVV